MANDELNIDLGKKKRLAVRKYNGIKLVDIREYYTDDQGVSKPGSKGISLTQESWDQLVSNIDKIKEALDRLEAPPNKKVKSELSKETVDSADESEE
ncbi:unnamed protein product [Kuraishia capsulata CBS 1993]|uniref:Transcriptional coactivator p15 (PC4) C-terminal domain-containing protein n=1 Tax=Kuraishia capsulata CBS 1993 TaxID=1382522 RepID=W6MIK2_9ASCO|nr:uncharacterized protein KUCA_T00001713001 [Kuraishia capsulata CBS 1993]CDK25743.1 unnamed protein product [Kuraishia capsulata CBS 1993]